MFLQNWWEYLHFLILVIKFFFFFSLIHLVEVLSILLSFSKNQILISLIFSIIFLAFHFSSVAQSKSWWWTRRPGVLPSVGSQTVGQDWAIELTELIMSFAAKDGEALYS